MYVYLKKLLKSDIERAASLVILCLNILTDFDYFVKNEMIQICQK